MFNERLATACGSNGIQPYISMDALGNPNGLNMSSASFCQTIAFTLQKAPRREFLLARSLAKNARDVLNI